MPCGGANPADNVFCQHCGSPLGDELASPPRVQKGERKQVTVLFADVVGFTRLSERLDPETVREIMEGCFEILCWEIERYQGTVGAALDRPGVTWARGSADYRIEWPEATVSTSARLDLRGDGEAFEVRLDLEAREGDELRWARTWHRRIPRQLG